MYILQFCVKSYSSLLFLYAGYTPYSQQSIIPSFLVCPSTLHAQETWPLLHPGSGCEQGVTVRPVLPNASWQVVCETLVSCLFPLPTLSSLTAFPLWTWRALFGFHPLCWSRESSHTPMLSLEEHLLTFPAQYLLLHFKLAEMSEKFIPNTLSEHRYINPNLPLKFCQQLFAVNFVLAKYLITYWGKINET